MRIYIPVACYHAYNTAVYVRRAFKAMGHDVEVITQAQYYEDLPDADLFFGVDSAGPLNFPEKHRAKTAMWFIDSRHNCDPARRTPDDDTNAKDLAGGGGWVFQAQKQDWERNVSQGVFRGTWLPLAADPDVWKSMNMLESQYDIAFGGNVWDGHRQEILDTLAMNYRFKHAMGMPEELALAYNQSRVGFNIPSFWGTPICYDVNMRVFEVMACGIPLVTNKLPAQDELGMVPFVHYMAYSRLKEIRAVIGQLLGDEDLRRRIGTAARHLILEAHTYQHRMGEALSILAEAGMIDMPAQDNPLKGDKKDERV